MNRYARIEKMIMHPRYVWQLPVRFFHWINASVILVLVVTGLIISNPPAIQSATEAYFSYWFGTVRFIHFVAAYVFFFNFIIRIYWGFAGNKFAKWSNFIPYTKRQWIDMWQVIKVDIFQVKCVHNPNLGHNALASFTYFLTFIVFLLQVFTGFGVYAAMSSGWLPHLFAWVPAMLGGDMLAVKIHYILMWFFILFAIVHVYLVFYHDYIEKNGVTSSMIGGWKFQEDGDIERETD